VSDQTEFSFPQEDAGQAYNQWQAHRRVAAQELARRLSTPASRVSLHNRSLQQSRASDQTALSFNSSLSQQGYDQWLTGRRVATQELAHRLNLPLGHEVEVWLVGGIRLRGTLQVEEQVLFMEEERLRHMVLVVDHVAFTLREMESCVRLD